jgi:type I restriction enzyme M protein
MLDTTTKQKIDSLRNLLVGKVPDPKSQVEQITVALFYKFMWDRDKEIKDLGGNATFFVGEFEKYSWENLFAPDLGGSECIKLYSEAIEEMENNPNIPSIFRDIFKRAFLPYNDPYTLRLFLKEINDFHYSNSEKLGDGFEYLLSILGTQGDAGQFRTPRHIIDFITEVVNPQKGDRIVDPACGTGGFIISAYKHILKTNTKESLGDLLIPEDKKRLGNNLVGLDIDPMMVKLALANMYLHGLNEPHIYEYDSLTSEERWDDMFDVVLANPPFMTPSGGIRPHKRFAVNATKAEVLFTSYINTHLSNNGRAGIVVPEGIIFQSGKAYKELRKQLIESSLIGVISLPSGVFKPYSGVKTSILILDKELNKKTDKIFFAKVENDGFDLGDNRSPIDKNDLPGILKAINKYRVELNDNDPILKYLTKQEILDSNGLNLNYDSHLKYDYSRVEHKLYNLSELIDVEYGKRIVKKNDSGTIYPVYGGGGETFRTDTFNRKDRLIISRFAMSPKCVRKVSGQFFLNDSGFTIKIKNPDLCMENYLNNILINIQDKIYKCGKGAAQKNIDFYAFLNLKVPLPEIEIQKEIVEELEQYQKLINGAKQVVENYKPHFEIDEKLTLSKLGTSLSFVSSGSTPKGGKSSYVNEGVVFIRSQNVLVGELKLSNVEHIPEQTHYSMKRSQLKKNDVLLNITGASIGRSALYNCDFEANVNQHVAILRVNDNLSPEFLVAIINSNQIQKQIFSVQSGGTREALNYNQIKELKIPLPSIEIQNQIVERLESERKIVEGNKQLIEIYSKKIENRINKIWGE